MDKSVLTPMVEQGLGLRPIGRLLNRHPSTVRYWVDKHGLKLKQKPFGFQKKPHRCCKCGESDPAKFYGHKRKICGRCQNMYNTKQGQTKRLRAIRELGGRCQICGFDLYSCSLDIHHKDSGTKAPNFRSLRGWSWERILAELKKCFLICKNCHAAVHSGLLKI